MRERRSEGVKESREGRDGGIKKKGVLHGGGQIEGGGQAMCDVVSQTCAVLLRAFISASTAVLSLLTPPHTHTHPPHPSATV